jgi:hypothetical protein
MKWRGNLCKILVGKLAGKRELGRPKVLKLIMKI